MNGNNNQFKPRIIRLEIGFFTEEISNWAKREYSGNLLDENIKERFKFWNFEKAVKFSFDIIPYQGSADSIFYHHLTKTFSDYLDATYYFTDDIINKFSWLKGNTIGVNWLVNREGYICLDVIDKLEKYRNVLVVPSNEIFQLCHNDKNLEEDLEKSPEEKIVEVNLPDQEKSSIMRVPLGIFNKQRGIGYRNDLGYVKAFPPNNSSDYSDETGFIFRRNI